MNKTEPIPRLDPLVVDERTARAFLGGISRSTLYKRSAEGKVRSVKLDGRRLFVVESLRDYVDAGIDAGGEPDAA